jgi:hypothetical protein
MSRRKVVIDSPARHGSSAVGQVKPGHRFCAVLGAKLPQDVFHVLLDRAFGDDQLPSCRRRQA